MLLSPQRKVVDNDQDSKAERDSADLIVLRSYIPFVKWRAVWASYYCGQLDVWNGSIEAKLLSNKVWRIDLVKLAPRCSGESVDSVVVLTATGSTIYDAIKEFVSKHEYIEEMISTYSEEMKKIAADIKSFCTELRREGDKEWRGRH